MPPPLSSKWNAFIKLFSSRLRDLCREEAERSKDPEVEDDAKEAAWFRHNRTGTYVNSQPVTHAQDLHGFTTDRKSTEEENGHKVPSLTKKLFAVGNLIRTGKICVL